MHALFVLCFFCEMTFVNKVKEGKSWNIAVTCNMIQIFYTLGYSSPKEIITKHQLIYIVHIAPSGFTYIEHLTKCIISLSIMHSLVSIKYINPY